MYKKLYKQQLIGLKKLCIFTESTVLTTNFLLIKQHITKNMIESISMIEYLIVNSYLFTIGLDKIKEKLKMSRITQEDIDLL